MSINRVNISGNLTRDPELKSTAGGTSVLTFGVAVNDRRRNPQTGEWEDVPNFVDCVVFGARAEPLSRFLSKGSKVAIEGKLRYSSWERDGQRRSKLEVIVDEVEFLSPRQGGAPMGGSQQYGQMDAAPTYAAPASAPSYAAPANQGYVAPANQGYAASAPQPARPAVSTPPSADVYDEDIPF
ncbi:MAG: single-stranded DNA-binding protein [Atopobiaceae bacterium]|nr:single-stranded DNA-binding protein [Atopobiaceae bacterium]